MDTGLFLGISARLVLGGGRGGRIRGAISRSLVVVVMGLGVEGRLGAAPLGVGSTGSVEDGTVVGSTAIGVVVSRGTPLMEFQSQNPQEGGRAIFRLPGRSRSLRS